MRKLGQELGVDAMALYRHVRDKDDLLDGVVEVVVGEIDRPATGGDWKAALRGHVMAARTRDAPPPVGAARPRGTRHGGSRGPGPHRRRAGDAARRRLLDGDWPITRSTSLSSRIFGFHQDLFDDSGRAPDPEAEADGRRCWRSATRPSPSSPRSASHEGGLGACDDDVEFAFGLDLILDGLERLRAAS